MNRNILFIILSVFIIEVNAQTITNYTTADGLMSDFVECIAVDIYDNIWFGTSVGLQMYDGVNWISYSSADFGLSTNNVKVVTATSGGDVYVGTDFGASKFDGSSWIAFNTNSQIKSIDEDDSGDIWLGTNQGVQYFDGTVSIYYSAPDLHWSGVNGTAIDSNGDKWFSSPLGGITHFDGLNFTTYDTSDGLLSLYTTDIVVDNQDRKWVGTASGMSVLDASNTSFTQHTRMYLMPPPDTLNPVVDIAIDSWGRIWTSIYVGYLAEGGVAYWNGSVWSDFHISDGLAGQNVKGLAIDSENNVWVATTNGVSRISAIASAFNTVENTIFSIFPNPSSDLIYLNNNGESINEVKIYDNSGILVYQANSFERNYIDVSYFAQGLYYVDIQFSDTNICKKIIVN